MKYPGIDFCYLYGTRQVVLSFLEKWEQELGTLHVRTCKGETDYELKRTLFSTHKTDTHKKQYWLVRIHTRSIDLMRRAQEYLNKVTNRSSRSTPQVEWIWNEDSYRNTLLEREHNNKTRTQLEGGIPVCTVLAELEDVQMWVDATNYFVKKGVDPKYMSLPEEPLFIRNMGPGTWLVLITHDTATYLSTYISSLQGSDYWVGGAVTWEHTLQHYAA